MGGFTLHFHFAPNQFFTNSVLTKCYEMKCEPPEDDPFSFEGPEIFKCTGCPIDWQKGKNLTVKQVKKKQKHKSKGSVRTITKQVKADSSSTSSTRPLFLTIPMPRWMRIHRPCSPLTSRSGTTSASASCPGRCSSLPGRPWRTRATSRRRSPTRTRTTTATTTRTSIRARRRPTPSASSSRNQKFRCSSTEYSQNWSIVPPPCLWQLRARRLKYIAVRFTCF